MKIALLQMEITDDLAKNLEAMKQAVREAANLKADLAVLPELWNSPFINERILAHAEEGPVLLAALQKEAAENGIWLIGGSFPFREEDSERSEEVRLYNRSFVITPSGQVLTWTDKMHLLEVHAKRHAYREADVFSKGSSFGRFETPWGPAALCICFDIRFPELARILCEDAEILLVPAGFNEAVGKKHWKSLLCARAIENEVFVAGVNGAAADYGTYRSYGHSMVVSPDGEILLELGSGSETGVADLDLSAAKKIRERSPFWQLRRTDLYELKTLQSDGLQESAQKDSAETEYKSE